MLTYASQITHVKLPGLFANTLHNQKKDLYNYPYCIVKSATY